MIQCRVQVSVHRKRRISKSNSAGPGEGGVRKSIDRSDWSLSYLRSSDYFSRPRCFLGRISQHVELHDACSTSLTKSNRPETADTHVDYHYKVQSHYASKTIYSYYLRNNSYRYDTVRNRCGVNNRSNLDLVSLHFHY